MCSFAPNGPGKGPVPDYDAPAALKADARRLEDPDPAAEAARRLARQLRQSQGHRRRPHRSGPGQPVARRSAPPSDTWRRAGCT